MYISTRLTVCLTVICLACRERGPSFLATFLIHSGQKLHYPYQQPSTHSFYKELKLQFQMPPEESRKKKGYNSQDCGTI